MQMQKTEIIRIETKWNRTTIHGKTWILIENWKQILRL